MNNGLLLVGLVVLLLAAGAQVYYVTQTTSGFFGLYEETTATFPYRYLALPLGLAGLVLIAVGLATKEAN